MFGHSLRLARLLPVDRKEIQTLILKNVYLDEGNGCWLWKRSRKGSGGYGQIHLEKHTSRKQRDIPKRVHRVSYAVFIGEIPEGLDVLHKCDVRHCCNPDHLFLGADKDNALDMVKKSRSTKGRFTGILNHKAKLCGQDIERIFILNSQGFSNRYIASRFGVWHTTIGRILSGKTWKETRVGLAPT